jgi:hypothetical protein
MMRNATAAEMRRALSEIREYIDSAELVVASDRGEHGYPGDFARLSVHVGFIRRTLNGLEPSAETSAKVG